MDRQTERGMEDRTDEWMWNEMNGWKDGRIDGKLSRVPHFNFRKPAAAAGGAVVGEEGGGLD